MKLRVPPPFLMLLSALIMWMLNRRLPIAHWITPPWNRIGAIPAAAGFVIMIAAFVRFHQARTTINPMDPSKASKLVTNGIFRFTRNPMYLGLVLLLTGWAVALGSAGPCVIPPLFVVLITAAQILPEEQALDRLFGSEFQRYRARVPRWIGKPW